MGEVFDLDAAYAAEVKEPFEFMWAGVKWQVPHLADLDWRLTSLADEMDLDAVREVLLKGMGERAEEWESKPQPAPAMLKLFDQWLKHSGQAPGEAQGSDDSSPESTAEPSQPTSTATTGSRSAKPSSGRRKTGSRSAS